MESRRQLDAARSSGTAWRAVYSLVLAITLSCLTLNAGDAPLQAGRIEAIQKLFQEKRWQQVVDQAKTSSGRSAEIRLYLGMALAQLGRWEEARAAFQEGQRLLPLDARFPVELGGVAFKQKRYAEAARQLRRGLQLNPSDSYAVDFLGTVYFLEGNLEAALKYWNRNGKPRIDSVHIEPGLHVDPVLLDRAFAFAPGDTLSLSDLLTSQARVRGLGIFPAFHFGLDAQEDGRFDVTLAAQERNGWGPSKTEALLSTFRGLPYQTLYPEYANLAESAINIESLLRWDAQKRRLAASVSGPLSRNPKYRYRAGLDLRDENWDVRRSFQGFAPTLGALNLRRYSVSGDIMSFPSGDWSWSTGGELSHRDYRNILAGPGLPSGALLQGYQLKHLAQLNRELWRVPERRFESRLTLSSEAGTIWSQPPHSFDRLQASAALRWMPQPAGDDYAIAQQFRAGKIFGQAPFDELFMLGLERDNDLWMRAHIGTRDGRKGSAPLGRGYFLSNWEIDKKIYNNGILDVKLSPFLDIGKITDSLLPESEKWLWDTGVQAKLRVFGVGFAVIYGKDLRSGNNALYLTAGR